MSTIGRSTLDEEASPEAPTDGTSSDGASEGGASEGGASEGGASRGESAKDAGSDPAVGRLLDERYRLLARLGEGGMGLVYEAKHEVLGSRVAIKLLRSDAAGDAESIARFEREAQSASAIGNEHIVDVRDFGRLPDGSTYVVMELIEGVDLLTELRRAPLPWQRACRVALQICEALGAAHEAGIVHRDLKPENVLLTVRRGAPDFVKIVDFGIAKVIHGGKQLTAAGRVIGTPEYMAPEQCAGRAVDRRTDIYALGILLYEMTTGQLPFFDPDLGKLVRMQMMERPLPPSKARPEAELPLSFEALVLRCLAKDPDQRFRGMRDVAAALERVLRGSGDATPFEETAPSEETAPFADTARYDEQELRGAGSIRPPLADGHASTDLALPSPPVRARSTPRTDRRAPRSIVPWVAAAVAVAAIGGGVLFAGVSDDDAPSPTEPPASAEPASTAPPSSEPRPTTSDPAPRVAASPSETQLESEPPAAEVWRGDDLLGNTPMNVVRPSEGERLDLVLRMPGHRDHPVSLSHLTSGRLRLVLEPVRRNAGARPQHPERGHPGEEVVQPAPTNEGRSGEPQHRPGFMDPWQ